MDRLRVLAKPRLGALVLATVVAVTGLVALPPGSQALEGAAAECNLVVLKLTRTSAGAYSLQTENPGICAISEYDPFNLPWDAAQSGRITIAASSLSSVTCVGSKVSALSGPVSIVLHGSSSPHPVGDVSMLLTDAAGEAPTVAFLRGANVVGAAQFAANGPANCSTSTGTVVTWSLGTLVLGEAASRY